MERRRSPLLHAPPGRALGESLVPLLAALLLTMRLHVAAPDRDALVTLAGLYSLAWCALRVRVTGGSWPRRAGADGLLGGVFALAAQGLALVVWPTAPPGTERGSLLADSGRVLALVGASAALFIAMRGAIYLWLYWDRLRRRRLRWALTHAHATVVAGGILLLGVLAVAVTVPVVVSFVISPTVRSLYTRSRAAPRRWDNSIRTAANR